MPAEFTPVLNKIYVFEKYTILIISEGEGIFQVDFKNYNFNSGHSLFLAPGQYLQLISGNYSMLQYEFEEKDVRHIENSRFLFQHLVSIGHIENRLTGEVYTSQLRNIDICEKNTPLLRAAIENWLQLNPFNTTEDHINLLFDLKEIIDNNYKNDVSIADISRQLNTKPFLINSLTKEKLEHTLNKLITNKLLLESKRKIVFTDLSVKEIAYETGFKDPDYFNRFFKKQTSLTPMEFRKNYAFDSRDTFIIELLALIDTNFKEEHFAEFYAGKLAVTSQTLSKKISQKLATTFTNLISEKLVQESKKLLLQKMPVNIIAFNLGFKEPNHFSAFFKNLTGKTPTQYLADF